MVIICILFFYFAFYFFILYFIFYFFILRFRIPICDRWFGCVINYVDALFFNFNFNNFILFYFLMQNLKFGFTIINFERHIMRDIIVNSVFQ